MPDVTCARRWTIPVEAIAPALLLAAWFAHALPFAWTGLTLADSAYAFQHAREFLSGKVLYRDILPHIPPLSIWIQAAWISVFGADLWVERVHFLLSYATILLLAYSCLRTALPPWPSFFAMLPMVSLGGALLPCFAWYNFDALVFFLLGTRIHLGVFSRPWTGFASGIAFGVSFLAKTNFGAIGLGAAVLDGWFRDRRRLPLLLLGFFLPLTLFALQLAHGGATEEFMAFVLWGQAGEKGGWEMVLRLLAPTGERAPFYVPLAYTGGLFLLLLGTRPIHFIPGALLLAPGWIYAWPPPFWEMYPRIVIGLLGVFILSLWHRRENPTPRLLPLLLFATALLATDTLSQNVPWIVNSCAFLALPLMLAGAWAHGRSPERSRTTMLAAISCAIFLEGAYARHFFPYQPPPLPVQVRPLTSPGLDAIRTDPPFGEELDAMLGMVREDLAQSPEAGFLAYPEAPALYVALRRLAPGRILNYARTFQPALTARYDAQERDRLAAAPPRWVLLVKRLAKVRPPGPYRADLLLRSNHFALVNEWIAAHYDVIADGPELTLLRYRDPLASP